MTGGSYEIFLFTRSSVVRVKRKREKKFFKSSSMKCMTHIYACLASKLKFRTVFIMIVEIASFCVFHVIVQENALYCDNIADGDSRSFKRWVHMKK